MCILDTLHKFYNEEQNKCIMLAANISNEELGINKGITICFMCVADVTEVHHDVELIELINEVNDINIEMKESAISEMVQKETVTLIPKSHLSCSIKIFTLSQESHYWMQSYEMNPNNN